MIFIENVDKVARLSVHDHTYSFSGKWITGSPWARFGLYNHYVVVRADGAVRAIPAHAGELVPGSTEDLVATLARYDPVAKHPPAPMTLELDPTYRCASIDCGGRCFSAEYRSLAPTATIHTALLKEILHDFASNGGKVVRFDGGGDPLAHPAVRNGELPEVANTLHLKSTILTSGDQLPQTDLRRLARANCYLRLSLNAATDATRQKFHGNHVSVIRLFTIVDEFADWISGEHIELPIGATFLLDVLNFHEVFECARISRDSGISHFSVRRVLGPDHLRPVFSPEQIAETEQLLSDVRALASDTFRVFVPWRGVSEPDLSPASGDFTASRCWQSTFKTVVEPDPDRGGFRAQLCGRYRGSGVGQRMQMLPLFRSNVGAGWTDSWTRSFTAYPVTREALPGTCVSCIDRGFILMLDNLLSFLGDSPRDFHIFHLYHDGLSPPDPSATSLQPFSC